MAVEVSIVMPVHNASKFLDETFTSISEQTWKESLEVSIYNDASTDNSLEICQNWSAKLEKEGISVVLRENKTEKPGGVGFAKNRAIEQSSGTYLCFLDSDDVMLPRRIELQLAEARKQSSLTIVGSQYKREPENSTERYTQWSNMMSQDQLYTQIYTSFGPTLINPTWFCHRKVFDDCGFFLEKARGYPEDFEFFHRHLEKVGKLLRIDEPLLVYRYHPGAATFSVHEDTIWKLRLEYLQKNVLEYWSSFTIWNAGRQGRKLFRTLSGESKLKVKAMCDVDPKKIEKKVYKCEIADKNGVKPEIPILHFKEAVPPFIICVKINMTNGDFEKNLKSLNLKEGRDYFHFS